MTPLYLLDTDALSEPLRPQPNARFLRRFRANVERIAISSTTWHEALFGMHRMANGKRKQQVREYLIDVISPSVPILPYDAPSAEWHAIERARLEIKGRLTPFADGQVAAVAKIHGLTIVTANVRHFAAFEGVEVETWIR